MPEPWPDMPSATDDESETPFPALNLSAAAFSSHLSPEDAYTATIASPPRNGFGAIDSVDESNLPHMRRIHSGHSTGGAGGGGRRRRRPWRKLMWVDQSYPDNYTDQNTFLENLQRNPRLKPYDFWPLVADSTVILQHVCSVIIFIVCFSSIFQERVSPVSVVSWSSFGTFIGWLLWERWVAEEETAAAAAEDSRNSGVGGTASAASTAATLLSAGGGSGGQNTLSRRRTRAASIRRPLPPPPPSLLNVGRQAVAGSSPEDGIGVRKTGQLSTVPSSVASTAPPSADTSAASSTTNLVAKPPSHSSPPPTLPPPPTITTTDTSSTVSAPAVPAKPSQEAPLADMDIINDENRTHMRLSTIKSAILIYSTLLGLSPILKSLTLSTYDDSIWAMSFWLLTINVFFFDYSGGVGAKFPASLSTNAALMASTVLASRLPSTEQVFSLTLFSIEVFGLFPVFRRHVRHRSWRYHLALTIALVLGAGFGVGMVIKPAKNGGWPWRRGVVGMVVSVIVSVVATGGCSWWLLGLQKYKNEIRGPWDQARPVIMSRPRWD